MKNYRYFIFIVLCFLTVNCRQNSEITLFEREDFPATKEVNAINVKINDLKAFNTAKILVVKDSIVLINRKKTDDFFVDIYDLNSGNKIRSIAPKGRGPNEYIFTDINYNHNSDYFIIWDKNLKKVCYYHIDSLIRKGIEYNPLSYHGLNEAKEFQEFNDTLFLCFNKFSHFTKEYSNNLKPLYFECKKEYISDENIGKNSSKRDLKIKYFVPNVSGGYVYIHPTKKNVVVPYFYTDKIEFYNKELHLTKTLIGPDMLKPEFGVYQQNTVLFKDRKRWRGYYSSFFTKDAIYLLYDGTDGISRENGEYDFENSEIFKITWDGQLIKRYILDVFIYSITIDSSEKFVYGTYLNEKESISSLVKIEL